MPSKAARSLPYVTAKSSRILGKIRVVPEDFQVEEIPAYPPSGEGDHVFIKLRKTGLTTQDAVRRLARALDIDPAGASWAGLKDRHAVTTQWVSLAGTKPEAARGLSLPGLDVLSAARHGHKLRTGHLRGNRFAIRVRQAGGHSAADVERARALMRALESSGCPNYFGEQRFGRDGDNARVGRAWVAAEGPAPRGRFQRKLIFSALQAAMFNTWLADRLTTGHLDAALLGDILRKEDTGGLFHCEDPDVDTARAARFEVSATGPMFGSRMRKALHGSGEAELAVLKANGLAWADLAKHKKHGEGTRRVARVRPHAWTVEADDEGMLLSFELPRGAYATVVLRELTKPTETGHHHHP
ncbi:MAG: tRNA pseudouridine(13) synthase TruD [Myxococcales bacterium]|nr:tRNA pseudouridine(13) synthase TruD [Myxococcales bacterium]